MPTRLAYKMLRVTYFWNAGGKVLYLLVGEWAEVQCTVD